MTDKNQQKYLEFQEISQRLSNLREHYETLTSQLSEIMTLNSSLNELKKLKKGEEILIPLGNNIFTKARLEETNKFIVGVGSNVLVNKTFEETAEDINTQSSELKEILKKIEEEINKTAETLHNLRDQILKEQ